MDNDVIEVVGVSSDSDVVLCLLLLDSLAPDIHPSVIECMCGPCGPAAFCFSIRGKLSPREKHTNHTERRDRHVATAKERSLLVRGSGMSASERKMELASLAGAPEWMTCLCVVEEDGRYYGMSQPNSRCNSGRGQSHAGFIYDGPCYAFCASTGRKADDVCSWCARPYTQEETERAKEANLFIRTRTEDGGIGVHRQDGGKAEMSPPFNEECLRGLTQWWFKDANGASRCVATGLMLSNGCIMDRQHVLVQLELIGQEHT